MPYEGLAEMHQGPRRVLRRDMRDGSVRLTQVEGRKKGQWTGKLRFVDERLTDPVRWRQPKRVFVNSMSDLFHEALTDEEIDKVFGVMWACEFLGRGENVYPGHTFQILTKRAERMAEYMSKDRREKWAYAAVNAAGGEDPDPLWDQIAMAKRLHPRIWLGVSVENQKYADERIPQLMRVPAAIRWISAEPLLGPVDLSHWLNQPSPDEFRDDPLARHMLNEAMRDGLADGRRALDWVVTGGESGLGARPFDIRWGQAIVDQCKKAGVPCFVKQLGDVVTIDGHAFKRRSFGSKGNAFDSWPETLKVREFPRTEAR